MDLPHVIVEISEAQEWQATPLAGRWAKVIPTDRRPTILQQDRETAGREALHLAGEHPGRRFVACVPPRA